MIGVEEITRPEYYPPKGDFPSLKITLEHARNQYADLNKVRSTIETKAAITLSISMAMIALIASIHFDLFLIGFFAIPLFLSLDILFPKPVTFPSPQIDEVFQFAKNEEFKAIDLSLISYMKVNAKIQELVIKMGHELTIVFSLITIGIMLFAFQLGYEITFLGLPL